MLIRIHSKFSIRSARCFRNVLNFVLVLNVSCKVSFRSEDRAFYWSIYDSSGQDQMSVRPLRHDKRCGWFSKSWGLSASVSFLSSPPRPRLLAPFFAWPLLRNSTETLASQAISMVRSCGVPLQHWRWKEAVMLETDVMKKKKMKQMCYHFSVFTKKSQVLLSVTVGSDGNGIVLLSAPKLSNSDDILASCCNEFKASHWNRTLP